MPTGKLLKSCPLVVKKIIEAFTGTQTLFFVFLCAKDKLKMKPVYIATLPLVQSYADKNIERVIEVWFFSIQKSKG